MSGRATTTDTSNSDHQSPITGGEFLLSLLHNHRHHSPSPLPLPHQQSPIPNPNHLNLPLDPAVAAVGPPLPLPHHHYRLHQSTPSPPFPPNFFLHGSSIPQNPRGTHNQSLRVPPGFENRKSNRSGNDACMFGNFPFRVGNESLDGEVVSSNSRVDGEVGIGGGGDRGSGVSSRDMTGRGGGNGNRLSGFEGRNVDRLMGFAGNVNRGVVSSRVDGNQGRELGPSDPFWGNHEFMSHKGYETPELGSSDPFRGNRESVPHRGFEARELGIGDPFNGNHDLMSQGGFARSDARWRTDSGGRPSGRNEGFEPNVGGERYRNNNDEFSHRGFHSSERNYGRERRLGDGDRDRDRHGSFRGSGEVALRSQLDRPGPLAGSRLHSESAPRIEEAIMNLHSEVDVNGEGRRRLNLDGHKGSDHANGRGGDDIDELSDQFAESSVAEDESNGKHNEKKHSLRDKDFRSDTRGQRLFSQRMRNLRRLMECRGDIGIFNAPFLVIFESLVPPEEEKTKQKQLLASLEKLVNKEWPDAKLYLYGSCANTFGVSKSDIDVCLAINDQDIEKSEILLKLAEILESNNLQDVQALTRARVPIVKFKDPGTAISCDICINNVLAVVNTKLLRDYAEIDVRLRQLAFIVKHWAKSRDVNATYQGTLSSYAYVLMCIHFLQHRRPAILPCLQAMPPTYKATVDEVECAFFDQVEKLRDFGAHNREGIAQLVWGFFNYWAYRHDYANSVISVRLGTLISKQMKDWTRRIGNDRHLICIEDPFETSHDLGRVVDRRSIRVLRDEFERAAEILQFDPNPCVTLFQPYIPS